MTETNAVSRRAGLAHDQDGDASTFFAATAPPGRVPHYLAPAPWLPALMRVVVATEFRESEYQSSEDPEARGHGDAHTRNPKLTLLSPGESLKRAAQRALLSL